MSTDPTVREVFEEVDPDPDAVLESYGASSPDDLVAQAGEHDPTTDDLIDADDTLASDLFGDLASVSLDDADAPESTDEAADDGEFAPLSRERDGPTLVRVGARAGQGRRRRVRRGGCRRA